MGSLVDQPAYVVAQHSYSRCLRTPEFFASVYERLLSSDPVIPPMFAGTEFPRQHKLLQHGLGLLLSYAKKPDQELLARIAATHSRHATNVPPKLYERFAESLIGAIKEHDPRFSEEIDAAWREALRPGIEYMQSRYDP
jgi:hemoglobin-like flavoprotein